MAKNSKLKLNKETIARLEEDSMRSIKGGFIFSLVGCKLTCDKKTASEYCLTIACETMLRCVTAKNGCLTGAYCGDTHKNSLGCPR